jgi:hypothetical protein
LSSSFTDASPTESFGMSFSAAHDIVAAARPAARPKIRNVPPALELTLA